MLIEEGNKKEGNYLHFSNRHKQDGPDERYINRDIQIVKSRRYNKVIVLREKTRK